MARMPIHIPRVALNVSGLDAATVARALEALPAAISASLASAGDAARGEGAVRAGADPGSLRFAGTPSAGALADEVAKRVADGVRSSLTSPDRRGA